MQKFTLSAKLSLPMLTLSIVMATSDSFASCNVKADVTFSVNGTELVMVNKSTGANYYWIDFGDAASHGGGNWDTIRHNYGSPIPQSYIVRVIALDTNFSNCADTLLQLVMTTFPPCYVIAFYQLVDDSSKNFSGLIHDMSYITRPSKTTWTWHFGDGDSSHSTNPTHIYPGPGKYRLCITITDSSCTSTFCDSIGFDSSGNIKRGTPYSIRVFGEPSTSVTRLRSATKIKLAPNPGSGIVHLSSEEALITHIKVVDARGVQVYNKDHNSNLVELNLEQWSQGIYFMIISNEFSVTQTIKLIRSE